MTPSQLLEDYAQALARLREALASPAQDDLDRAGCIQYFEFCFELAWKTIKAVGEQQGLNELTSPRACLRQAFASGWISAELLWLEMLDARNRMSHTCKYQDALVVYEQLPAFLPALEELLTTLRQEV